MARRGGEPRSAPADPYRRIARYYDRVVEPMSAGVRGVADRVLPPQPGWSVLDVGCGTGTGLERYLEAGCRCFGVDVSPAMLARAHERLGDGADLQLTDGTGLPFEAGTFDLVTISMVLHEVAAERRAGVMAEMARVVKPDGRLLITDFRFGSLRGIKGPLIKAVTFAIERAGGHYSGYRSFRRHGGVPALASGNDLVVEREKIVAGGNLAVYVAAGSS
jgi:ubiquinone/menaquinone biosynthesis C-methylase UbiE